MEKKLKCDLGSSIVYNNMIQKSSGKGFGRKDFAKRRSDTGIFFSCHDETVNVDEFQKCRKTVWNSW